MPYGHKWAGLPFWSCDEQAICKYCGAEYHKTHVKKVGCADCTWAVRMAMTPAEKQLLNRYFNICARYKISPRTTSLRYGSETISRIIRALKSGKWKVSPAPHLKSEALRWMQKFCNEFEVGWYELKQNRGTWKDRFRAVRREEKAKPQCPRKFLTCVGGFLPHTCPKQLHGCDLQ